jgi:hypothetical protein
MISEVRVDAGAVVTLVTVSVEALNVVVIIAVVPAAVVVYVLAG